MGQPKMLMPWGNSFVLAQVITTIAAGLSDRQYEIIVVTGDKRELIETQLAYLQNELPIKFAHNPDFNTGEMLSSLQSGLAAAESATQAMLIVLGDQPQIQEKTVKNILQAYDPSQRQVIVPSYKNRRGHPYLVNRFFADEIFALKPPQTMRDFLNKHTDQITYVEADESIMQDLDTPEDYKHYHKSG